MADLFSKLARPLAPLARTVREYRPPQGRRDLMAAATVAVVDVPQSMAYALIAGVPPQYGLYTSMVQGFVSAVCGSSSHTVSGPTNTSALLVAATLHRLAGDGRDPAAYVQLASALLLVKGLMQLAMAAGGLGGLVRYVSRGVIVGVAAGAGILILVGQAPAFLGLSITVTGDPLPGVVGMLRRTLIRLGDADGRAVMIGLGAVGVMLGLRAICRFAPGALVAVVGAAVVVAVTGWRDTGLPTVAPITSGLPSVALPTLAWTRLEGILGGAAALAILGSVEPVAIAKSLALRSGEKVRPNQELFSQGLASVVSAFFQGFPGSGSFGRSALLEASGGQTRVAAALNAVLVALIAAVFAPWARYIPLAGLAAVLIVVSVGLVDVRYIARLARADRSEAVVCLGTLAAVLLAPLQYAVFIGMFLNLALYLRKAGRLHVAEMVTAGGQFLERPLHERAGGRRVVFLQVEGDLFFAVADELEERLAALAAGDARAVILRLKRTHSMDATVMQVIEQFTRRLHQRGGHVILCGLRPAVMRPLRAYGLAELIGPPNLFEAGPGAFSSARRAVARARELVGASIDLEPGPDAGGADYHI